MTLLLVLPTLLCLAVGYVVHFRTRALRAEQLNRSAAVALASQEGLIHALGNWIIRAQNAETLLARHQLEEYELKQIEDRECKKLQPELIKIDRERKALGPDHRIAIGVFADTPRRALALLLSEIKS